MIFLIPRFWAMCSVLNEIAPQKFREHFLYWVARMSNHRVCSFQEHNIKCTEAWNYLVPYGTTAVIIALHTWASRCNKYLVVCVMWLNHLACINVKMCCKWGQVWYQNDFSIFFSFRICFIFFFLRCEASNIVLNFWETW